MRKLMIFLIMLTCSIYISFSQDKPRLGILPFTGGISTDGETIANLFSYQREIANTFTVVPRTSAVNALIAERDFQLSGYTNSDTIARLGRMLNADFIVSGHIQRLGKSNLIIITIINVETFEQLAGDYHVYNNIEDVRNLLPSISAKLIDASRRDTSRLPKLAVAPFNVANIGINVNVQSAETLAQILAIEISNTGKYAVLPRTTTMTNALMELEFQRQGYTAEEGIISLGKAINAEFVLSADVRRLGNMNMFTAQILNVEDGRQIAGNSRDYIIIDDGINLMAELAILLTHPENAQNLIAALNRERTRMKIFGDETKFWSIGISAGTTFAAPWVIGTIRGTIAPLKYQFIEIGVDFGFISGHIDAQNYFSIYPFINYAFYLPINENIGWFAGAGAGFMFSEYTFPEGKLQVNNFAVNFTTGVNINDFLNISYTLRTNFESVSNKIAVGYTYRF